MATRSINRVEGETPAAPLPDFERPKAMTEDEVRYMRGEREPAAGSVPMSTSRFLNSPLFVHAFTRMSLRRQGDDIATTYDIPDMVRGLADVYDYPAVIAAIEEEKASNPAFRDFLKARRMTTYDPAEMGHYAAGTLGAAIRDFMKDSGYQLNFVNATPPRDDFEYLRKRFGDSHDIQHLVTGFGPNSSGENALALMNITANARFLNPTVAQFISMGSLFVTAAAYARVAFNYPQGMSMHVEALEKGIAAGRAIRIPLVLVAWEDYLDWDLEDIAADLGFTRGPGAAWMISNQLCRG